MFAKALLTGLSGYECLGYFVVLLMLQVNRFSTYLVPKRPDLFKDVALLQAQITDLHNQVDGVESDVTALKMGTARNR